MPLALAAFLCIASGFILASVGWPRRIPFASDLLWRASMSVGYGLGIFSVSLFFSRVCGITHLVAMDLLIFAFLFVGLLVFRARYRPCIANEVTAAAEFDCPVWLHRFLKAAFAAERAASKSLEIARRQLQLGAIGYLGLLTVQNTYETALLALVQAQAARYADTAALFQALGGGWWNREDAPAAKKWDIQFIP